MNLTVIDSCINPTNCYAIEIITDFYFGSYSKFEIQIKAERMLPYIKEDNPVDQKDLVDVIICLEVLKKVKSNVYEYVNIFNKFFETKWTLDDMGRYTILDDYNLYYYDECSQKHLVDIELIEEERMRIKNELNEWEK